MSEKKGNVKQQKWSSDDQAMSLLRDINSIIGDEANAEQKRIAAELERKKKEEQESELKAEENRKKQGEERLTRERQLQEEKERKRQEELKAQEREKKIKAGEIDPAKEEADRKAAEEEKRRQDLLALSKDKALTDAQDLIRQQQAELRKLSEFSLTPVAAPTPMEPIEVKRSPLPIIITVVVVLGGAAAAIVLLQPPAATTTTQQVTDSLILKTSNGEMLVKLDPKGDILVDGTLNNNIDVYRGGETDNKIFEHNADPWKVDAESLTAAAATDPTAAATDGGEAKPEKSRRRKHDGERKASREKKDGGGGLKGMPAGGKGGGFSFNKGD